tara:strand:- start:294 stop:527 length:234 start_codon:yes stop_codon:yes gene_type:complete
MSYTGFKKISIKTLTNFSSKVTKKKLTEKDDLFKILDSLEIMTLLLDIENNFKVKLNMIKLLNDNKLDLKKIASNCR